jgi:tellurite methyltransferase
MGDQPLDTAHEAWDRTWGDATERAEWEQPHPAVLAYLDALRERGATRVLDIGGGVGRHALGYAQAGFATTMIDASPNGVTEALRVAAAMGLDLDARVAPFTALPVEDHSVDHALAWNVLYHGDRSIVSTGLSECQRVLRAGGTLQLTMLSKRNHGYGVGREIRPDTFVDDAGDPDKAHPHFYADAATVCTLLADHGFEVRDLNDVDMHPPGAWHWTILADLITEAQPGRGVDLSR